MPSGSWTYAPLLRLCIRGLLMLLVAAAPVNARQGGSGGTVTGRLTVPADDLMESLRLGKKMLRYGTHTHSSEPIEPYSLAEVAVVYLEGTGLEGRVQPPDKNPRLDQFQMVFRPLVLPVVTGTTVDFPNNDDLFHNVFSYSQTREFDLGRYPKGQKKSVRFEVPGVVNVYCDIHSYMFATILVFAHSFFTLPSDDGTFRIPDVPPGEYDLSFWYGRKKVATRKVIVEEGKTSEVNLP